MIICLVRRSDILHMDAIVRYQNEHSQWIVVSDLVSTEREMKRIQDILHKYHHDYRIMKSSDVVKYLKGLDTDFRILRQDHWKGWRVLNNVHKYGSTIYTDYVTLPYATTTRAHTNGVRKSVYLNNCSKVYRSFKPQGIIAVPSVPIEDPRESVLMVFHFDSESGIPCSFLTEHLHEVISWINKNKERYNIIVSLHPEMYKVNEDVVEEFMKIDGITVSDDNVYSLAKSCDYIIADGISILYESSLLGKGVSYLCNGKKLFGKDYNILYDNVKTYFDINDIVDLKVNYSQEVKEFVEKNSCMLSHDWERPKP